MESNLTKLRVSDPTLSKYSYLGISTKIKGVVFSVLSSGLYYALVWVVLQFYETFSSFGAELRPVTRLFINANILYLNLSKVSVFLLVIWMACLFAKIGIKPIYILIKYYFIFSVALFIVVLVNMYLQMFQLGGVV